MTRLNRFPSAPLVDAGVEYSSGLNDDSDRDKRFVAPLIRVKGSRTFIIRPLKPAIWSKHRLPIRDGYFFPQPSQVH
jgi:hypothetical protein